MLLSRRIRNSFRLSQMLFKADVFQKAYMVYVVLLHIIKKIM